MENLNDLKTLFSFVPSFKDKSVLQLGSDPVYTQLFIQEDSSAKIIKIVDTDQSLLQKNEDKNSNNRSEFIKSDFKSLNLSAQK